MTREWFGPLADPLRAFAVRYLTQALEAGRRFAEVAQTLGVSEPTLQAWRKGKKAAHRRAKGEAPKPALVPVEVSELKKPERSSVAPAGTLTVVAPGGFRVEGLSVEAAAVLLRKLTC